MANSADPDQMLHSAVSDLGILCLPRPAFPNTYSKYYILSDSDVPMLHALGRFPC